MKVYEEYKKEHPEELVNVEKLLDYSVRIQTMRKARQKAKLEKIEECRRLLYGEHSE